MTTETAIQLLTAEEFYALPDAPHGGKMELICGRTVTHLPVGRPHSRMAGRVYSRLDRFVEAHRLGEVGLELGFVLGRNPDVVRAPDVHFVRRERLPDDPSAGGFIEGAPDLAVEVTSPGDRDNEVIQKLGQYQDAGAPRVWVVRPEFRTVTVHYLHEDPHTFKDGDVLTSHDAGFEVEGFELAVTELFGE